MSSDDKTAGRADENKTGSDGADEVGESNAVGRNDEQYPALCGRSGVEGYSILVMLTIVYYLGKSRFRY